MSCLSLRSSACQGLQTCLEPQETHLQKRRPRVHRWVRPSCSLPDLKSLEIPDKDTGAKQEKSGANGDGWSSIISLCAPSQSPLEAIDKSSTLSRTSHLSLPPLGCTKRRFPSNLSLEMCTENLGCETGAFYSVGDFHAGSKHCYSEPAAKRKAKGAAATKRSRSAASRLAFPPPLTTLSGEDRVLILSKREGGRLMLLPVKPTVLQAERRDGRLRLRLLSHDATFHTKAENVEAREGELNGGMEEVGKKTEVEIKGMKEEEEQTMRGIEAEEKGLREGEEEETGEGGMSGMSPQRNDGEEAGLGKYRRPGSCKEEEVGEGGRRDSRGKPMPNWQAEAFSWVASS